MNPFRRLVRGQAPTFLNTEFANSVLMFLNAIMKLRITPSAAGKIIVADDSITIDLSPLEAARIREDVEALKKALASTQGQVDAINAALKNATITATCDPVTSAITVTLVITKLP